MRIGILSDTHGNLEKARQAIKQMGPIDALIHAGDHYLDAESIRIELGIPVHAVIGNNDYKLQGPAELEVTFLNQKFYILHGHQYASTQTRMQKLYYAGIEKNAQVVIFGHTHVPFSEMHNEILIFNPGSIYRPRSNFGPSYGIITIENEKIIPKIYQLQKS